MPAAVLAAAFLLGTQTQMPAVVVVLDYTYDDNGFFNNTIAKAALEKAADDIEAAINPFAPGLGPISGGSVSGISGDTTVTFSNTYYVRDPEEISDEPDYEIPFNDPLAADTVRIFVGSRALSPGEFGKGSTAGIWPQPGASGDPNQLAAATAVAEANANLEFGRGGGPIISSSSGYVAGTPYTINFGSAVGSLALNSDPDLWHYDSTTNVAPGKIDLYSIGLHEMLHVLGFGTSQSWDVKVSVSGNDWLGLSVIDLVGSGVNLVGGDFLDHITKGTMSTTVVGGYTQEAAMDPDTDPGQRKYLTQLDVAFLKDIGWNNVPEPSTGILVMIAGCAVFFRRRRD